MGNSPYDFIMNYKKNSQVKFVHRTFNSSDLVFFFTLYIPFTKREILSQLFVGIFMIRA